MIQPLPISDAQSRLARARWTLRGRSETSRAGACLAFEHRQSGPLFQAKLDEAKEWLMRELACWNVIQDELLARRYKNNFYDEKEIARERSITKLLSSGSC